MGGRKFTSIQQARAILKYMLSKGWLPNVVYHNKEDAEAAQTLFEEKGKVDVDDHHLQLLITQCRAYAREVTHNLEIGVFGANENGLTTDLGTIADTRAKEVFEETGQQLDGKFFSIIS